MSVSVIRNFVAFTIFSFLLFSCNSANEDTYNKRVKHFRHLVFSETPYDKFQGIYPLTGSEAEKINNYTLSYDEDGKLTSVAYMRGEDLLGYSGRGYAKVEISYTDSTETHHYFNKDNRPQEYMGVFVSIYKLDAEGNRIGLSFMDRNSNKIENRNKVAYFIWKILPDGMVQEKRYNLEDEETVMNANCPFYELRFSYDKNGYCTRLANYMADTLYNCTIENCGDIGVSYFLFEYNEKGGLKKFSVFNVRGQMSNLYSGWSRFINTLDKNGYVTEVIYYDQDNEPLGGRNNPITATVYDEHGAVIERKYMDKDRNLFVRSSVGAAVVKYSYDEEGHPVDTTYFDTSLAEIVKK